MHLRVAAGIIGAACLAAAVPLSAHSDAGLRRLRDDRVRMTVKINPVTDPLTGEPDKHDGVEGKMHYAPEPAATAPDGVPMCEIYAGPHSGQENMADAWRGPGTCDSMIASGKSCEQTFCPECSENEYCNKACGFCESTVDEPVDCNCVGTDCDCWSDDTCVNDEVARATADPFHNELSPFTQGCAQIATNGYCEDQNYIALGVRTFCCESCELQAESDQVNGKCDFMAVVNGCQDLAAVAAMNSGNINLVCDNACSRSVMDNWTNCLADPNSDFAEYATQLEPIVTGCRNFLNGGHYEPPGWAEATGTGGR